MYWEEALSAALRSRRSGDPHGVYFVTAQLRGTGKSRGRERCHSPLLLHSFVTLYVKLPPLQDFVALDAGDDHHQALHDALVKPL